MSRRRVTGGRRRSGRHWSSARREARGGKQDDSVRIESSRGGGTGRRIGLKIRRTQKVRVGSIPTPGTKTNSSQEAIVVKPWWLTLALVAAVPGGLPTTQDADLRIGLA